MNDMPTHGCAGSVGMRGEPRCPWESRCVRGGLAGARRGRSREAPEPGAPGGAAAAEGLTRRLHVLRC